MIIRAVFLGVRFGLGFKLLKCNKMYFPGGGLEKFPLWFKDKITTTYGIRLDCGSAVFREYGLEYDLCGNLVALRWLWND